MANTVCQKHLKVTMIGDSTVGKTTFIDRYIRQAFVPDYKATIGGKHSLQANITSLTLQNYEIKLYLLFKYNFKVTEWNSFSIFYHY